MGEVWGDRVGAKERAPEAISSLPPARSRARGPAGRRPTPRGVDEGLREDKVTVRKLKIDFGDSIEKGKQEEITDLRSRSGVTGSSGSWFCIGLRRAWQASPGQT